MLCGEVSRPEGAEKSAGGGANEVSENHRTAAGKSRSAAGVSFAVPDAASFSRLVFGFGGQGADFFGGGAGERALGEVAARGET